ncbi:uncharacterized protein si:ch211-40k21.5 [Heptranchias perlo]|uniref:uncharacterized protein si:ch211-40k21.5 n=1 Tax=Heptranchias perlo TaxID=212740 RepID=UPI00355ACB08
MARILLDVFIEKCMNQPGPNLTVQEVGLDQEATGTCGSAKEDNEQCDLDSFPSLSAGSESTVTLSHPSSIGSFQDDTDADLFSGADSQSESNSKSPGRVRRRPERLPLPNHEAKEEEEWDSGSESNRFERCNSRKKEVDLRNEEMTSTVPANRLPAGPESQGTSHGEIIQVYIGEGGEPTCPAIKKEQEETCSLPSPVGSVGSESTVTLSHPSSDISFEDDCFLDTAVGSESETEGLGAVTNRKKPPALPDHEAKSRNAKWDQLGTLDIGEEFDRWNFMKDYLKLKSDEEMARVLLDLYTKTHAIPASPLTTLCAFVKKV